MYKIIIKLKFPSNYCYLKPQKSVLRAPCGHITAEKRSTCVLFLQFFYLD